MPSFPPFILVIYAVLTIGFLAYAYWSTQLDIYNKFLVVFFYFGITVLIWNAQRKSESFNAILNNCGVTQGQIIAYSDGSGAVGSAIEYHFAAGDQTYSIKNNDDRFQTIPGEKPNLDLAYLVLYDKTDPKNSIILLRYPVIEPGDIEKYRQEFSQGLPEQILNM